jgi:hypothetical protein
MQKILHSTETHTLIATAFGRTMSLTLWEEATGEEIVKARFHIVKEKEAMNEAIAKTKILMNNWDKIKGNVMPVEIR